VAIGGVTVDDLTELQRIGVSGIAVSGYVLNAPDPVEAMKTLITYGK
jgi:thiamine-phosphate pyrophosphorylase